MFAAWKALLASKKFWYAVVGSAVVAAAHQFGASETVVNIVAGFFGLGLAGQAAADFGKEKAKIEYEAPTANQG